MSQPRIQYSPSEGMQTSRHRHGQSRVHLSTLIDLAQFEKLPSFSPWSLSLSLSSRSVAHLLPGPNSLSNQELIDQEQSNTL